MKEFPQRLPEIRDDLYFHETPRVKLSSADSNDLVKLSRYTSKSNMGMFHQGMDTVSHDKSVCYIFLLS